MNEEEINKLANAYIELHKARNIKDDDSNWWAFEKFIQVGTEELSSKDCLNTILVILEKKPPDKVMSVLAAGPLEDLIDRCGEEVIDNIERLARQNPKFKNLLGGVWECSTPDIWSRVLACRGEVW
jgi:hypothetical protein